MKGEERKWKTAKSSHWLNNNLTEKKCCEKKFKILKKEQEENSLSPTEWQKKMLWEKIWNGGEKLKTGEKLTITTFSMQLAGGDGGGGPLFPWLTEGGRLAWPIGQQLNWKKKLCKKVSNGGDINDRRTHCHCFLHATCERGTAAGALICLADWGRTAGMADRISISLKKEAAIKSLEWW